MQFSIYFPVGCFWPKVVTQWFEPFWFYRFWDWWFHTVPGVDPTQLFVQILTLHAHTLQKQSEVLNLINVKYMLCCFWYIIHLHISWRLHALGFRWKLAGIALTSVPEHPIHLRDLRNNQQLSKTNFLFFKQIYFFPDFSLYRFVFDIFR